VKKDWEMVVVGKATGVIRTLKMDGSATAITAAAATAVISTVATQGEEGARLEEPASAERRRHRTRMSSRLSYRDAGFLNYICLPK